MCQRRVTFTIFVLWWSIYLVSSMSWEWTICNCYTWNRRKVADTSLGVGRTQHWKEYILELSESIVSRKRHVQYKRGFPQSIQCRLGGQADDCGGRGSSQQEGRQWTGWRTLVRHTLTKWKLKGKTVTRYSFSAKFVLCSNNENFPVYIEPEETRYWVRKVRKLEKDDTSFLQKLKDEIPAFLYHLQHRDLTTKEESRMWFSPALIRTAALEKIIRCNRSRIELDMAELLLDIMDTMQVDVVDFCINDLLALFNYSMIRVERHQIRNVLQQCWKLEPAPNALSYSTFQISVVPGQKYSVSSKKVGRFYTVTVKYWKTTVEFVESDE